MPTEATSAAGGPLLAGITVLNLATVGPAARAAGWLGDYGATVVDVAPVPGRAGAQILPAFHAYGGRRGHRRLLVDLQHPDGVEVLLDLARTADVLIESFRPGVADRLGVGYPAVSARNERIVYCSTTGYGQQGPYSMRAGHDLDYLAIGGFLFCSGRAGDGAPAIPGATVADSAAGGMHAVIAVLAALTSRATSGRGRYLDVAVVDGVLALMALQVDEYLATGLDPGPRRTLLTGRFACYDVYRCADDAWIAVAAVESRFWANFCRALGLEVWIEYQYDDDRQPAIRNDVSSVLATRVRADWVQLLAEADTCVAPVLSVPELVADEHLAARDTIVTARHPEHGEFPQLAPLLAGAERAAPPLPDPRQTDTEDLLRAAGVSSARCADLLAAGVVA